MWDTEEEETYPEGEEGESEIQSRMMNSRTGVGWNIPEYTPPPDLGGPPSAPDQGIIGFNPAILNPSTTSGMECPITHCNSILTPPIYQCYNGHAICNRCIETKDYCTQCMASLDGEKTRNFALEQILFQSHHQQSADNHMKCPNELQGCVEVGPSDYISSHAEICKFGGSQYCSKLFGWRNCAAKVGTGALVHHLRDNHAIKETDETKFSLNLIIPSSVLDSQSTTHHQGGGIVWNPLLISSAFDSDILLKYYLSPGGYLNLTGYLLRGVDNDDDDDDREWKKYRIKLEINSASKVARMEWTGCLISILQSNSDNDLAASNVNTFRIPLHSLEKYSKATEELELEETALSKIKVKVAIWKHTDDGEPAFKQNVFVDEGGEKEPLSKFTFLGKEPTAAGNDEQDAFTFPLESFIHLNGRMMMAADATQNDQEEYARYYSVDSCCTYCKRPLFGNVTYQCIQCPQASDTLAATYFCRSCIEVGNHHSEHLTVRISRPALQPLAAVVYESVAGELH